MITITRRDVSDAILLCQILATHEDAWLWCSGFVPEVYGTASCGHSDPWNCVAAAIGASLKASALFHPGFADRR